MKSFQDLPGHPYKNPHGINTVSDLFKYFQTDKQLSSIWEILAYTGPLSATARKAVQLRVSSRLAYFPDGAGKYRYIAIGNWILQRVLYPLHCLIIKFLRVRLRGQDATYDQSKIYRFHLRIQEEGKKTFRKIHNLPYPLPQDWDGFKWKSENIQKSFPLRIPISLDLSRATDRLPLCVQIIVLIYFTGSRMLGVTWLLLMGLSHL